MYKELDLLLSAETSIDSWYDDGSVIASEILMEFSLMDWDELSKKVRVKPIEWQKKLAYCLDSNCHIYELTIILSLLEVEDKELTEICIDTLRSFTSPELKKKISENQLIISRINELMPDSGAAVKKILDDFLEKMKI